MRRVQRMTVLALVLLALATGAAGAAEKGILVVTDADNADAAVVNAQLRQKLKDMRSQGVFSGAGIGEHFFAYDFTVSDHVQKLTRLGFSRERVPRLALVELRGGVPVRVLWGLYVENVDSALTALTDKLAVRRSVTYEELLRASPSDDELWGDYGDALGGQEVPMARGAYSIAYLLDTADNEWAEKTSADQYELIGILRQAGITNDEWVGDLGDKAAPIRDYWGRALYEYAMELDPADTEWPSKASSVASTAPVDTAPAPSGTWGPSAHNVVIFTESGREYFNERELAFIDALRVAGFATIEAAPGSGGTNPDSNIKVAAGQEATARLIQDIAILYFGSSYPAPDGDWEIMSIFESGDTDIFINLGPYVSGR